MTTSRVDEEPIMLERIRNELHELGRTDAPLTAVGVLMLAALAATLAMLAIDQRSIAGAPAWLKPAKFAASTAIYSFTLAWIFSYLPEWRRMRRVVSLTTAVIFVIEVAIIDVQAWRGTTSHFNVSTPFDGALYSIMGIGILIQTLTSLVVVLAVWRQRFADAAMGWAIRAGLSITVLGAFTGGLMTRPTAAQLADARATHRVVVAGAHTVGAPDGGPGLPGTGWSLEHGDLRVPHFVGLHAVQALGLFALTIRRRRGSRNTLRLVQAAAVSYALLFAILLWQALRGESLVAPSAFTLAMIGLWIVLTTGLMRAFRSSNAAALRGTAMLMS